MLVLMLARRISLKRGGREKERRLIKMPLASRRRYSTGRCQIKI